MVTVAYHPHFEKTIRKINDAGLKERVKQQILRIIEDPAVGKPMRYCRKQTREVYVPPFRLSYWFDHRKDTLVFPALYHKDERNSPGTLPHLAGDDLD